MCNRTNQILESISFLSGFDLLSPQAPPLALQKKPQQISYIGEIIVDQRLAYTRFAPDAITREVIALVNSLGGTPISELYGVYGRLATLCEEAGIHLVRNLIGPYCTSLDMTGISITLLKVDDELMTLWDAPVHTPALRRGC